MKDLQWHEPAAYRRAIYFENERADPLHSLKFAGAAFVIMLGLRFLAGLGSEAHPPPWPPSIAVAVGVAVFAAYGLPLLMSLLPGSIVILSEKGVNNNVLVGRGWQIRFWSWQDIAYLSAWQDTAGGKPYTVISLYDDNDSLLATLALANSPSLRDIEAYLAAHGKRLAAPPNTSAGA